jgi:hypothetical protein
MTTSLSTRSVAVAALLLALGSLAGQAGAAVLSTSQRGFEGGPALASDGRVVVGELRGNGALAILAIDPRSGAVGEIASYPPLADPLTYNELELAGTGGIATAALRRFREATGVQSGPEQDIPVPRGSRVATLLSPGVEQLSECARRQTFSDHDAAGGEGFVATIGGECGPTSTAVTIRNATGTLTIPVAPETSPFAGDPPTPNIKLLRAAGPFVSWVEEHHDPRGGVARSIVVARAATGQVLVRTPIAEYPGQIGLGADGTVAFSASLFCAIGVVSPAAPSVRAIRLPAGMCPYSRSSRSLAVAGGRIVFGASTGYAVSDLQGVAVHPLVEAVPRGGNVGSPVAFDGATAFVVRPDCDVDRLLAIDVDAVGVLPVQTEERPCPVRRAGSGRVRAGRNGFVRIALRCTEGCRGTLRLVQQRRGGRERLVGEAAYRHGSGTFAVRLRIASYARALAGCAGGLRANAIVFPARTTPRLHEPRGLGAYRIGSPARCRRSGGPPFAKARRGPRP